MDAAPELRAASTEPGPDDPGDAANAILTGPGRLVLQRSRGRMTPETLDFTKAAADAHALQRSRGRMTPETRLPEQQQPRRQASTEPGPDDPGDPPRPAPNPWARSRLQRSRGRMTPETTLAPEGHGRRRQASTEPGPDDPGDAQNRGGHLRRVLASTEPGPDDPGDAPYAYRPGGIAALQRSRGRMTPETRTGQRWPASRDRFNGAGAG